MDDPRSFSDRLPPKILIKDSVVRTFKRSALEATDGGEFDAVVMFNVILTLAQKLAIVSKRASYG
jgi:hypothetical protein